MVSMVSIRSGHGESDAEEEHKHRDMGRERRASDVMCVTRECDNELG